MEENGVVEREGFGRVPFESDRLWAARSPQAGEIDSSRPDRGIPAGRIRALARLASHQPHDPDERRHRIPGRVKARQSFVCGVVQQAGRQTVDKRAGKFARD